MIEAVRKFTEPMMRRILLTIGRGVVQVVKDDLSLQELQISLLAGEVIDGVERFQNYGFTSHPLPGAEAAAIFIGGSRDHGLVIAVDDRRFRLKELAEGEVAIYTDEEDKIHFKRGNKIEIKTGTIEFNTEKTDLNTNTIKIQNSSGELIQVLSDLVQAIMDATTVTMAGPQPLVNPAFATLKSTIDSFKE